MAIKSSGGGPRREIILARWARLDPSRLGNRSLNRFLPSRRFHTCYPVKMDETIKHQSLE